MKHEIAANKRPRSYPPALKEGLVKLAELGHSPRTLTMFGPSEQSIRNWVQAAHAEQEQEQEAAPSLTLLESLHSDLRVIQVRLDRLTAEVAELREVTRPQDKLIIT